MTEKNIGGLSDHIVLKNEKEVIFYLHNPFQIAWKFQQS